MSDTTVWLVGPATLDWQVDLQVFPDPAVALDFYQGRDEKTYEMVGTDRCIIIRTETDDAYYGHARTLIERTTANRYDYHANTQQVTQDHPGR
jgi:hypothetical protein